MSKVTETFELYGKTYTLETGEIAKQATGSCVVRCGDTMLLLTATISKEDRDTDFFPLTVEFAEKLYSVGRIPGGYLKREGRPSDKATLTARMIDRPIRPCFTEGFRREVQIVATTFCCDQENAPDTIAIMGASTALMLASAPFSGPVAAVRIARDLDTGEFIVNPIKFAVGGQNLFVVRVIVMDLVANARIENIAVVRPSVDFVVNSWE